MIHPYFNLTGEEAKGLLYGLLETNKIQLRKDPSLPSMRQLIRDGRVVYRQADPNEHWQSYREIVDQVKMNGVGYADCEDLAPAVAAEDQMRFGIASQPYAYRPKEGLFHVVTAVPKGSQTYGGRSFPSAMGAPSLPGYRLEDPSAAAGMSVTFGGLRGKSERRVRRNGAPRRMWRGLVRGTGQAMSAIAQAAFGPGGFEEGARQLGSLARSQVADDVLDAHDEDFDDFNDFDEDLEDDEYGYVRLGPQYATGVYRAIQRQPVDFLMYPLLSDEEEDVSEMVVAEHFGAMAPGFSSIFQSYMRARSSSKFGATPWSEEAIQEGLAEFIEERL